MYKACAESNNLIKKEVIMVKDLQKILLTEDEVCEILNLNVSSLQRERCNGTGIPYVKLGRRVRYKIEDIEKYIKANTVGGHRYD